MPAFIEIKSIDQQEVIQSIKAWMISAYETPKAWEANNLHVDEILSKFSDRALWVSGGLYFLELLTQLNNHSLKNNLIPFLHIELANSINSKPPVPINSNFIQSEISEFTPPSLNFCTKDYYIDFYLIELLKCDVDDYDEKIFSFYFRTYFDKVEDTFSREIYVFGNLSSRLK